MKQATKKVDGIKPVNVDQLTDLAGIKLGDTPVYGLLLLIAEMSDAIANGENVYMTIGANMAKTSLLLTLTQDGEKTRAGGATLSDLAVEAADTL